MPYRFKDSPQGIPSSIQKHDGILYQPYRYQPGHRDEGIGGEWSSGWPRDMTELPNWVIYPRKSVQDLVYTHAHLVSEKLRALIEDLDPHGHQFKAVEFRTKAGPMNRYWWNVCRRLDTVHEGRSNYLRKSLVEKGSDDFSRFVYRAPTDRQARLVFDLEKIGDTHFWTDKHTGGGWLMSTHAHDRFVLEGVTGVAYSRWPEHR